MDQQVEFREEHGHCNVPQSKEKLGKQVNNLRSAYKKYCAGKQSTLTSDSVSQLEEVGFKWFSKIIHKGYELFDLLVSYANEEQHCDVPRDHKNLGCWVAGQRTDYKKKIEGKASAMTDERIEKLNGIGFNWTPNKRSTKTIGKSS